MKKYLGKVIRESMDGQMASKLITNSDLFSDSTPVLPKINFWPLGTFHALSDTYSQMEVLRSTIIKLISCNSEGTLLFRLSIFIPLFWKAQRSRFSK